MDVRKYVPVAGDLAFITASNLLLNKGTRNSLHKKVQVVLHGLRQML